MIVMKQLSIDTEPNGLDAWAQCYSTPVALQLSDRAVAAINSSRKAIETIISRNEPVYGINTGFGSLSNQLICSEDLCRLQENLILGLTVGVGAPLPTAIVRLAIALKVASFAKGYSGVRLEVVNRLQLFLEREIYPVIPEKGSVGASGDLAPLAHISAALIGVGEVECSSQIVSAESIHRDLGLTPIRLEAKEGLAMVNGTQISTALALASLIEARRAFATAITVGALTTEAALGLEQAFDSRIHAIRRHKGQFKVAGRIK